MKNYYEKELCIPSGYTDQRCELGPYHASLMLQDAMTELFYQYQCDAVRLSQSHHAVWVVARSKIFYESVPFWMDRVRIRAFPVKLSPVTVHINVLVESLDGTLLMRCRQELCAMDIRDHSLRRIDSTPFPTDMELLKPQVKEPFRRMKVEVGPEHRVLSHEVRVMDTDMNGHMNNAAYLRLVMDSFSPAFWQDYSPAHFDVHYVNEGKVGDVLQVYQKREGMDVFVLVKHEDQVMVKAFLTVAPRQKRIGHWSDSVV